MERRLNKISRTPRTNLDKYVKLKIMSVKEMNCGNLQRFSSKAVQKNSSLADFPLLRIP